MLTLALLVLAPVAWAETLRVATWSFPSSSDTAAGAKPGIEEAALALKPLDPDVILLERVPDWETCSALAQALQPADYTVLVCSAFRRATNATAAPQQVAILSRRTGYFSWSEPWQVEGEPAIGGGFAFAAIRFAKHRVGFFAAQVDPQAVGANGGAAAPAALSRRWAQTLDSFKSWVTNRLEAVVVAGGDLAPDSPEAVSTVRFLSAPLHSPVTLPGHATPTNASSGVVPVGLSASAKTVPGLLLLGPQVACALNLDAPKVATARVASTKAPTNQVVPPKALSSPAAPRPATSSALPSAPAPSPRPASARSYLYLLLGAAFAALLSVLWFWVRRRRARSAAAAVALLGNGLSSYTLVVSEPSSASSVAPAAAQPPIPQRVPPDAGPGRAPSPVEAWPPGPVLLSPEPPRAAAQDSAGLRLQLAQWLKQKLVQRLLSDRSTLLKTQQTATGKLLSFEERLAKLEQQLQQQQQAYEQRILELNRELAATQEGNRELIRARIAQVQAEMQTARARLLAQARAGER